VHEIDEYDADVAISSLKLILKFLKMCQLVQKLERGKWQRQTDMHAQSIIISCACFPLGIKVGSREKLKP
jgi:hypothetical protein